MYYTDVQICWNTSYCVRIAISILEVLIVWTRNTSQHCNSDQNVGVVCESLVQVTVSVHRAYRTVSTPKNYTPMVWIASIGDKNQEIVQDIILARDTELRALIQK